MAVNTLERVSEKPRLSRLPVHVDDFCPRDPRGVNFGVKFIRDSVYGPLAARYHEAVVRGYERAASKYEPMVDKEALAKIMDVWNISDPYEAGKFYQNQLRTANNTTSYFLDVTVPGWKQNYSLMYELTSPSENPSWGLGWSGEGEKRGEDQLVYEAQRQSLLAIASGSIHARTEEDRLGTVRARFQKAVLNVYKSPIAPKPYVLLTEHDEETGKVVSVGDHKIGWAKDTHLRRREYQSRFIDGIGPVIVEERQKGDPEMILKMLAKAKNRMLLGGSGYLQPEDATDAFGMKLVVVEPGENGYEGSMNLLQDKLVDQLLVAKTLPIKYLEPDNGKSTSRGSSDHHDFLRLQVHLDDVSTPFEIIIQNAAQMRNDEVMYGGQNPEVLKDYQYKAFQEETGIDLREHLTDGSAHDQYKFRRSLLLMPTLFPAAIYGNQMVDRALDNYKQLGDRLRDHDRLPKFDITKFDVWCDADI